MVEKIRFESRLNMTLLAVLCSLNVRSTFPLAKSRIVTPELEQVATRLPSGLKLTHLAPSRRFSWFHTAILFCAPRSHSSRIPSPPDENPPDEDFSDSVQAITKNFPSGLIAKAAG